MFLARRAKHLREDASPNRQKIMEHQFSDFCFLLSHHSDFSTEEEDLKLFEAYIQFFLDAIATSDNISYLYASASKLKTVKDKFLDDSSPLYIIAEMLMVRIRQYCASHNWTLQTYPGKPVISREYYQTMSNEKVSENLKRVYYNDGEDRSKKPASRKGAATRTVTVEESDEEDSGDSDVTQVEKRPKLEPTRKSARAKNPVAMANESDQSIGDEL